MYLKALALSLFLATAACSTTQVAPPVTITKVCQPPAELMKKHPNLVALIGKHLSLSQILTQWIDDTRNYNDLNADDSALIDWITAHCQ